MGCGGRVMTHSAGSVTIQSIAFKYVMSTIQVHLIFETGDGRFDIH